MTTRMAIGEFARASHLTVKTLRHYHRVGLLTPAAVDPDTGYRHYVPDQLRTAQLIRRFRALDMPLDGIAAVLAAPDPATRADLLAAHLDRLEADLARTRAAVTDLRDLLTPSDQHRPARPAVEHREVPATPAAAIRETIRSSDALAWLQGALAELAATLRAQGLAATGPAGGLYVDELFTEEGGDACVFLPCDGAVRAMGRVAPFTVPAAELATVVHPGGHDGIDRAYGALGAHVARHELTVPGPLREYYLRSPLDGAAEPAWLTEVAWPVFAAQRS